MKILFLTSWYLPHSVGGGERIGGAERVVQTLAAGLRASGHEPIVLTTGVDREPPERSSDGVRIRSIPVRNVYDFSAAPPPRGLKPFFHLLDSRNPLMRSSIEHVLEEEKPDVIHSHVITGLSPSAWDAAARCGIPVVHTLHDYYVICARSSMAVDGVWCRRQHLDCALLSIPRRRAARSVGAVVGVSRFVLALHQEAGAFVGTPASVINNPCHLVGSPLRSRSARSAADGPVRFGFMGRIELNKGIVQLLESVRSMPPHTWSLQVAGTGAAGEVGFSDRIRSEYASDHVAFVGRVDPKEFLPGIDVLVVPSTETFGMSAAEALALGVPVVASKHGGLPELIEEGRNGFLFDPDEPADLARILTRIAADRSWIANAATDCITSVERLAPSRIVAQYVDLYMSMIR